MRENMQIRNYLVLDTFTTSSLYISPYFKVDKWPEKEVLWREKDMEPDGLYVL